MAIPVSNLPFIPTATPDVSPAATPTQTPISTSSAGDTSPFQTVLAAAQAPQPASVESQADATDATNDVMEIELETELDATLAAEPSLAGLLGFVTQTLAPPENAAVAQATGQAAELAAATAPGDAAARVQLPTDVRSRADQLRLDRGAGAVPNNATNAAAIPAEVATTEATTARANTFFTTNATADEAVPVATPNPTPTPAAAAVRVATTAPNGGSSIPAQGQIVANLIPPVPTPANLSVEAPPVSEPTAAVAASALPSAGLGERPATAGEQYVADATAGARLVAPAPSSVVFSNTLAVEVTGAPAIPAAAVTAPAAPVESTLGASTGIAPTSVSLTPTAVAPVTAEATAGESGAVATFGRAVADIARFVARSNAAAPTAFAGTLATEVNATRLPVDTTLPLAVSAVPSKPDDATQTAEPGVSSAAVAGASLPTAPVARAAVSETTAARVSPAAQIADTIVTHARVLERDGNVEFQMRLDPPELGRMQIRLVTRGDEVHGQVLVADEAVRGMIESQLPELRQRLEAAGVNVQRFEVSADASGNGGRNAYRDTTQEFAPRQQIAPTAPRARIGRAASGTLDVTV